ncbi:glycosyltransferase family 2 protein [Sphingobacterium sp. SRCM116780]|uniref:glycosyltransferase family A protein n=1 Tax=Sphingobacterium sp. SRCM116780 TaxID=2907623 RepID=UPI001F1F95FF|nr:glycosyltransferase family 2 protein [Sphingobacterium sp. SRCM116780]UIR56302.1 glycosyltransferase family 2 protein [Sphingobacterium sp. SRCM116780]
MFLQSNEIIISVIIPIYNQELFLDEAIQSVFQQSYPYFELILVNDGSTDRSAEICQNYTHQYDNVYYFEQSNSGVSVARNNGLAQATGSYVFFLDADDTIGVNFLKETLEIALINKNDIVVIGEHYCSRSHHVMALPTCAMFLKMDFLKKYPDIRFPEGIQPCEDGLFSHQLLALTTQVGLNPNGIYNYRQHDNQNHVIIDQNSEKVLLQIPKWFSILKDFYTKHNLYRSQAFHLALFIEHEPFEFRYLKMRFSASHKKQLFELINTFMDENVLPFLSNKEKRELSVLFQYFLIAKNFQSFDKFYKRYQTRKLRKIEFQLLLIKIIPFSKIRRKLRTQIRKKYNRL